MPMVRSRSSIVCAIVYLSTRPQCTTELHRTTELRSKSSQAAGQQQNDEDQENQTSTATRIVAPARTVRPRRQRPDHDQHQDDEQDQRHVRPPFCSFSLITAFGGRRDISPRRPPVSA